MLGRREEAGKSRRAVLRGVLVFDGSLCHSIGKVAARVKVLPRGGGRFPSLNGSLNDGTLALLPRPTKKTLVAFSNNTQRGRLITQLPLLPTNALPALHHYLPNLGLTLPEERAELQS